MLDCSISKIHIKICLSISSMVYLFFSLSVHTGKFFYEICFDQFFPGDRSNLFDVKQFCLGCQVDIVFIRSVSDIVCSPVICSSP
jgi:hypothetical protein